MTVAVAAFLQQNDTFGEPLAGGKVFTYAAGTLTPLASYTDQTGTVPNTNPVILDSAGRAQIWLTANVPYKLILTDAAGVEQETTDNFYAGASPEQLVLSGIVPSTGGTYTGPVALNGGATFGGTAAQDIATLDSLGAAAIQNVNLFDNSDFNVWQRSGTPSTADGAYGFDRIVNLAQTGLNTLSKLVQPTDGIPFAMRITQPDASPKRIGFAQIAENSLCAGYRGKNLVFSVRVRSSAAATLRCALVAWTGTADSPTRDVVNTWTSTNYTAGNFFVANTTTIATAGVAATANVWTDLIVSSTSAGGVVAPSTMTNLYMVVWTEGTVAQNVTLDAANAFCGQGSVAQLWTPPHPQVELAKCKRHLPTWRSTSVNDQVGAGQCVTTTSAYVNFAFDVEARAAVTALVAAGGFVVTNAGGGSQALTGMSLAVGGRQAALITAPVGAGLVSGNATTMQGTSASSSILFTGAELGV